MEENRFTFFARELFGTDDRQNRAAGELIQFVQNSFARLLSLEYRDGQCVDILVLVGPGVSTDLHCVDSSLKTTPIKPKALRGQRE